MTKHDLLDASGILLLLLLAALLSGCAAFPATSEGFMDTAKAHGCEMEEMKTADVFSWRFLSMNSTRTHDIKCRKVKSNEN